MLCRVMSCPVLDSVDRLRVVIDTVHIDVVKLLLSIITATLSSSGEGLRIPCKILLTLLTSTQDQSEQNSIALQP